MLQSLCTTQSVMERTVGFEGVQTGNIPGAGGSRL
jgi:hypothetical protein